MSKPKPPGSKLKRTPAQKAAATRAEKQALDKARAQQLAQIVNLHIAGFSLQQIGEAIGATEQEVDRLLATQTARYVKSQPALRTYVRNWVSERYTQLLESVWDGAVDTMASDQLDRQDRALRILDKMTKLHGAEAPVQHEVQVDSAPEAVEKLVSVLAATQGVGYDMNVFDGDVIEAEVIEDAVTQSARALEVSGNAVEEAVEGEDDL